MKICFVTSYNNFISDHNSTVVRVALDGNQFTDEMKETLTFDRDSHMKIMENEDNSESSSSSSNIANTSGDSICSLASGCEVITDSDNCEQESDDDDQHIPGVAVQSFGRKFKNIDMTSCWLNSCVQLTLTAIDHCESQGTLTSELGLELLHLQLSENNKSLESTNLKYILVTAEDTRIATRISELAAEIDDPIQLENRTQDVKSLRLNLIAGQQCVRDFFLCLNENFVSWPDVYFLLVFKTTHSTRCSSCQHIYQSETAQMYVKLQVPPDNSNLNDNIEEFFNASSLVGVFCENGCQSVIEAEKSSKVTRTAETEFITVILTRAIETLDGFQLNKNKVIPTNDVFIR